MQTTGNELITASRLTAFRTCPRKHRYAYELGYRERRSSRALRFGTVGHRALEAYWRARQAGLPAAACLAAALDAIARTEPEELDAYDCAMLEALVRVYARRWDRFLCEVLAVEAEFKTPLRDPDTGVPHARYKLAGKLDVLVRSLATRQVAIVEHKFTSMDPRAGGQYRDRLALDGQISQYFIGAEVLGYTPDLVLYDVIGRPSKKPLLATPPAIVAKRAKLRRPKPPPAQKRKKGEPKWLTGPVEGPAERVLPPGVRERDETPEEFHDRVLDFLIEDLPPSRAALAAAEAAGASGSSTLAPRTGEDACFYWIKIPRTAVQRSEYEQDVWGLTWMIDRMRRRGIAPLNTDACFRYGAPCAFWRVCKGVASLDDGRLFRRAESVHEELGGADAGQEEVA